MNNADIILLEGKLKCTIHFLFGGLREEDSELFFFKKFTKAFLKRPLTATETNESPVVNFLGKTRREVKTRAYFSIYRTNKRQRFLTFLFYFVLMPNLKNKEHFDTQRKLIPEALYSSFSTVLVF